MHSIKGRCVKGLENILFAGMSMHLSAQIFYFIFYTGWGSEGVNVSAAAKLQYKKQINSLLEMSICCKNKADK